MEHSSLQLPNAKSSGFSRKVVSRDQCRENGEQHLACGSPHFIFVLLSLGRRPKFHSQTQISGETPHEKWPNFFWTCFLDS